jgi:hypothetical protein
VALAEDLARERKKDRAAPRLWVRRFVLYEYLGRDGDAPKVIRDQPLFRGLNIIQGIEASELPQEATIKHGLTGHAVGKTLFCRLIRHGLGEHRYGTPAQKDRIEKSFPNAWLGLEAVLDGEPWAILRKIGSGEISYSAANVALEGLLPSVGRKEHQGLEKWWDALGVHLTKNIRGIGPEAPTSMDRWLRLLCWCARDQETRFRKLWQWRSADSESSSPNILKPEAYRLMKGTLGLLNQKEAKMGEDLQKLATEIAELETEITALRREPEYRIAWCAEQIARLEAKYEGKELEAAQELAPKSRHHKGACSEQLDLIESGYPDGPLAKVVMDHLKMAEQVASRLRMQIATIDGELLAANEELDDYRMAWDRVSSAVTKDAEEYARQYEAKRAGRQALVERVRKLRKSYCSAGKLMIGDCTHYHQVLAEVESGVIDIRAEERARQEAEFAKSRQGGDDAARHVQEELQADIKALREARLDLSVDVSEVEKQVAVLERDHANLLHLLAQQEEAERWNKGDLTGSPLAAKLELLREKEKRKAEIEKQRTEGLFRYTRRCKDVTTIFNTLVREVVGETFQGKLRISEEDLAFEITEDDGLHSEAVNTLANLLADTTAMLASIKGIGVHPRFLLHDSPREGDLDRMLYDGFLDTLHGIHTALGGQDEAPFQYIVTTTTTPVKTVQDIVRMKLCAWPRESMLFQRILGGQGQAEPDLFQVIEMKKIEV